MPRENFMVSEKSPSVYNLEVGGKGTVGGIGYTYMYVYRVYVGVYKGSLYICIYQYMYL